MARSRGSGGRPNSFASPAKVTKIPLNDDNAEKAKRQKERSMLQDVQRNNMIAAATPNRRATIGGQDGSPKTPRNVGVRALTGEAALDAVTPLRKVPILANFEEWMKMATDNKINAANSWNFALIDYFHEMSLLKEGDSVNFQKASCTLDGCVKIYTSRVDSVATETGKLLSGLADSSSKRKGKGGDEAEDGAEGSDEEEDEEGRRKPKKRAQRSSESTLAKDFSALQIKKFDLEFSVDPLFKKASADFDEGGAKGLLLNHLNIDNQGRIVFDSSDDKEAKKEAEENEDEEEEENEEGNTTQTEKEVEVDAMDVDEEQGDEPTAIIAKLDGLRAKFFPDMSKIDNQDICPSLKNFDLGDPTGTLDIPFLKALEDRNDEDDAGGSGGSDDVMGRDDMTFGFDDGFGVGADDDMAVGFGEGGEIWANETIADAADRLLSPTKRPMLGLSGGDDQPDFDTSASRDFTVGFGGGHEDILAYFDEALKKNWAGPEHWRIRKIKDSTKQVNAPVRQRKEKEAFEIDFMSPAADISPEAMAAPKTITTINMPKKDRVSKTRHLLPDDKHFNSRQLLRLFLKPKASLTGRRRGGLRGKNGGAEEPENVDEEFWAKENMEREILASSTPDGKAANYDANFFNDDHLDLPAGLGDEDDEDIFADAREMFSPGIPDAVEDAATGEAIPSSQIPGTQATAITDFGTQLITQSRRVRPEYVQYARVAKKVDVRKLKENLWTGLQFEDPAAADSSTVQEEPPQPSKPSPGPEEPRKFTDIVNNLRNVYTDKTMSDISTSYCFICLLHLANEKGLVVSDEGQGLTELLVTKDMQAGEADAY